MKIYVVYDTDSYSEKPVVFKDADKAIQYSQNCDSFKIVSYETENLE